MFCSIAFAFSFGNMCIPFVSLCVFFVGKCLKRFRYFPMVGSLITVDSIWRLRAFRKVRTMKAFSKVVSGFQVAFPPCS